jgi:hypothetical protein
MREMITDRPDRTESPYTVDAGHFQIEADILSYSYDRYNSAHTDSRVEAFSISPINLKAGLLGNLDGELILQTYNAVREHDRTAGSVKRSRGFGDIIPRLKWNLWGNDGGSTAFGIMPFFKIPTSQDGIGNNAVEGGIILPLAIQLGAGWEMGVMSVAEVDQNLSGTGEHFRFSNSLVLGHQIVGKLAGYVEFFSAVRTERGSEWLGTADVGLTYLLTENLQLDIGVNVGVTRSADDINPFLGISYRY